MYVVGEGITLGTTVSSIVGTTVTLSANANATLSSDPVGFYEASKALTPGLVAGQLCKAWVNFNGTGTVAIRASYNVSSITDNGVGAYTVNLTSALQDVNCAVTTSGMRYASSTSRAGKIDANMASTTTVRLFTGYEDTYSGTIAIDLEFNHVAIFR
jgi:hypothetical protein